MSENNCAKCGKDTSGHAYFMFWKRKDGKRAMFLICPTCHDEIRAKFPVKRR
jgi:hypothetical protein